MLTTPVLCGKGMTRRCLAALCAVTVIVGLPVPKVAMARTRAATMPAAAGVSVGGASYRLAQAQRTAVLLPLPAGALVPQAFSPPDHNGDTGSYDCAAAATTSALQILAAEGRISSAASYATVRRAMRLIEPGITSVSFPTVVHLMAAVTDGHVVGQGVTLTPRTWEQSVAASLRAGEPLLALVVDWSSLAGHWTPRGYDHTVLVVGLQPGFVWYIDPADGHLYRMARAAFAAAWANPWGRDEATGTWHTWDTWTAISFTQLPGAVPIQIQAP